MYLFYLLDHQLVVPAERRFIRIGCVIGQWEFCARRRQIYTAEGREGLQIFLWMSSGPTITLHSPPGRGHRAGGAQKGPEALQCIEEYRTQVAEGRKRTTEPSQLASRSPTQKRSFHS